MAGDRDDLVVHDAHRDDPTLAFALARLADSPNEPTPIGVFRAVERPVGITEACAQARRRAVDSARARCADLLHGGDTWTVA